MSISTYVSRILTEKLERHRVVVWYDVRRDFHDFISAFSAPNCYVVMASESRLKARREAEEIFKKINDSDKYTESQLNMLIYLPFTAPKSLEENLQNPFEVFARAGTVFGVSESERLDSIARQVWPDRVKQIDRLFAEGKPTITLLESIREGRSWPLLKQALGTQSVVDVVSFILCEQNVKSILDTVPGTQEELIRFLSEEINFTASNGRDWQSVRSDLITYILLSEFAFDLPSELPDALSGFTLAGEDKKDLVFKICEKMRGMDIYRDSYLSMAEKLESDLRLPNIMRDVEELGVRDTFAFEEKQYLNRLVKLIETGDLNGAQKIIGGRQKSVWRHRADRSQIWTVAERCLKFLSVCNDVSSSWKSDSHSVKAMIEAYTGNEGWFRLDGLQRLFEQSAAECVKADEISDLVELCRRRYREVADPIQEKLLSMVEQEGWPPDGFLRQTQIFNRFVAEPLERREKVAYFLGDALRYEMGRYLGENLIALGEVVTHAAASVLPATTACGMAALMPGADGAFLLESAPVDLTPSVEGRKLKASLDRMNLLKEKYGDRFSEMTLNDLLSVSPSKISARIGNADLLVVRVPDLDALPENLSLHQARKFMTGMLSDFYQAAVRLADAGFRFLVLSADHGHVLLPEIQPGDVVQAPPGEWVMSKRRCRVGQSLAQEPGTIVFKAEHVGIQGDVQEICIPKGFKVFSNVPGYFHEGLSLQECVIPVIVVHTAGKPQGQSKDESALISYKKDHFTNKVFSVTIAFNSLFTKTLRGKLEAFDGTGKNARVVGNVADCPARDDTTHEVIIEKGKPINVPIKINDDFEGPSIELRMTDPDTKVIWARLKLKNAVMD